MQAILTVGAISAIVGVAEYGIFDYDNLNKRPRGTLGHYMTYSGLLMLVMCSAAARLLFERRDRIWPALVMPALIVALALTFTRNAWVGGCVGIGVLLMLKDFRLLALVPVAAGLFFALAPGAIVTALLLDLRPARPDDARSRRDVPGGHRDREGPPAARRRPEHGAEGLPGVPAIDRRRTRRRRTCTTCRLQIAAERGAAGARRLALVPRHGDHGAAAEAPRPTGLATWRPRASARWRRCWPPASSSTTSATRSS